MMRVISSDCRHLVVLVPTPPGVDGVACVTIGAEIPPNGDVRGTLPLAWGLVDTHVLDTLPRRRVRARIFPASPTHRALSLLLRYALDERAQLLVSAAPLGRRLLREPFQQGRGGGDVLAFSGEARGTLIVFEDPPVYVAGGGARALRPHGVRSLA
jgi:hypothetical protein